MFGRRRNAPFQPLGLRLQRFGRRVMRNYAPSDSGPTRPASAPAPAAWQQSANEPLLWRSPDANSAPAPQQAAPAPQPQAAPYVPEPAAPPPPAGGIGDEANDFNLLKILAAHESRRAPTPPAGIARKLAEATSSTASDDSGDGEQIQTSRRRSRAAFDYVKTDALRADMTPNEIQSMQRTAAAKPAATPAPAEDVSEGSYTEIDHAGEIQRSADDSGMTDGNNADVTTADSSEDTGAPTDMLFAPPSDADAADISPTLSPNVQREIDPDVQRLLDNALEVTPSSGETAAPAPSQPGIQRQAAPRAVPSQSESTPTPTVESPRPASQPGAPIQRDVADNAAFTPAPQETRIPTPGTPAISRTADPSAVPSNTAEGRSVPLTANDAPIQPEPASEVQRLLDQATTVTPASSASSPRPETPIQRTATDAAFSSPTPTQPAQTAAGTPASPAASTPNTPAASQSSAPTNTPIQRTTTTETAVSPTPRPSEPTAAPIQREHDPEIQRLLDQAMTVTPASSAITQAETPAPTASTPIQRTPETSASAQSAPTQTPIIQRTATTETTASPASRPSDPTAAPIQRTPETSASAQSAPTQTPIQRTATTETTASPASRPSDPTAAPIQRMPETSASAQSAPTQTPIQRTAATETTPAPIQREHDPEVQRLLDQAMTVTPASSATTQPTADTPATPSTPIQRTSEPASATTSTPASNQPIQRTPETSASAQSAAPDTAAFSQTGSADTPIQRTPETPTSAQSAASTPDTAAFSQTGPADTPIQREHNPEVQRLLDQAMTVTPASSAVTSPSVNTPAAPAAPSVQRTPEPTARPSVQRTPEAPISGPADNITFTPTSNAPVQREHDPEVQRLLDQALSVNPSTSAESPAAPTAPTSAAQSVQHTPTTSNQSSVQRTPETPKSAGKSTQSARSQADQSDTSFSAPTASAGPDAPVQREINSDVQRLLDQALTVTPATRAEAPQASAPTSASTSTTPIQRTASQSQTPVSGPIDSGSFTPAASTAQPSVQREIDPNVQSLLDQALSVNPSSSAAQETPVASIDHGRSTPSVQRAPESPAATNTPSVQRTSRDTTSNSTNIQRTPADAAPSQPAAQSESGQRTLDPSVQSLLDQALSVNPSSSAEAPAAPAARPVASNTADTPVQRTARDTGSKQAAKPAIQRSSSETPVQRTLDPQVQRMLDQAMGVTPASSAQAPTTSQPAASTSPARPNLQRQATPQQPTSDASVSPSMQSDPFNRTLDPAIQRRLEEAMRVTPSSPTVARSAKTPLPVESRRPFIPTPTASADAAESTPTAGTPTASPVQRSAATPPAAPKQPGTPAASKPAAPNTPQGPSSSLESDLLRWMGMPADTPVEGRLSRKPSDSVDALMRKAETSTARPSENSTPDPTPTESTAAASNPTPASQPSEDMPSISPMGFRDLDDLQRAIVVDEVSSTVSSPGASGEGGESSINDIAQRVLDILRTKLRLERERNRKF